MCGIAGIVCRADAELGIPLRRMLRTMQHRGPDGAGFVIGDCVDRRDHLEKLDFTHKRGRAALGHVRLAITGASTALQPFQSRDRRLSLLHNGEIYNYRELLAELGEAERGFCRSDSEVIMQHLVREYDGNLQDAVARVLGKLDGVYALAITDQRQTIVVRDRIGVRQLYFSQDYARLAFASEKKPLWELFDRRAKVERVPPGHMLVMDSNGPTIVPFWKSDQLRSEVMITSQPEALSTYGRAIREAVHKRIRGRKRVGIIFSGGIDSVLIAYLTQKAGVAFTCYAVGCGEGAPDLVWAREVAERLQFPLQTAVLSLDEVESMLPEVITNIEDHSLNQVEVAIPIHMANRMAQEAGERVLLTGQGADELFGGYPWYSRLAAVEGYDRFVERSWEDACLLYKECLEREDKISMAHSLELRVPYLDPKVIHAAFRTAPELKIRKGEDRLSKRVHRDFCRSVGIPETIANRFKEAAQHGANVHATLEALAQRHAPIAEALQAAGYDAERSVTEKLGSSSRYGYRYGDVQLWKPAPQVQFYLDCQAARLGWLPPDAHQQWQEVQNRLAATARS